MMGRSARNYWTFAQLLDDYRYWRHVNVREFDVPRARENMKASWNFYLGKIGCANGDIDSFVQGVVEGRA